ncbi:MAG: 1-phosphofructokinase family hexose kinase [Candidatus Bipolaricaulis sp.]|nr:1-phosphofructokinase family hexose kinase [Candidatus Bipolaricaulis sp.]
MIVTVTLNPAVDKIYWVDSLRVGRVVEEEFLTRATRSSTSAGGKGVNMSVVLSQLGMENVAMGFIAGSAGHVVARDLRAKNVTTNFVWTRGETRTNAVVLEEGQSRILIFIGEAGPAVDANDVKHFIRRYRRMLPSASWVVLAGSLPPGVDADLYRDLATMAREAGAKVILSAGGDALQRGLEAGPTIVKPDTREERLLEGRSLATRETILEAGRHIVDRGQAQVVIVSHEVTGDVVVTRDAAWEIRSSVPASELKNLVGADDAFLAGTLFRLANGEPMERALRFGLAAGVATAESEGKVCGDVGRIEARMNQVTVDRIS